MLQFRHRFLPENQPVMSEVLTGDLAVTLRVASASVNPTLLMAGTV